LSHPATSSATPNGRDIVFSSPDSPKRSARSHTACVSESTFIGSLNVKRWYCDSERAWSISVRASAESPLIAQPMCESISASFSTELASCSGESSRFSTASTMPSDVEMPIAVVPILIASIAYST